MRHLSTRSSQRILLRLWLMLGLCSASLSTLQAAEVGRLIVRFEPAPQSKPSQSLGKQVSTLSTQSGFPLHLKRAMDRHQALVDLGQRLPRTQAQAIAAALSLRPEIRYAQADIRLAPQFTPNDPRFNEQWHLASSDPGALFVDTAWDTITGDSTLTIAVVDTGIVPHLDLDLRSDNSGRIINGYDFISADSVNTENDGTGGRDADASDPGDWVAPEESEALGCPAMDSSWHGTHVAGEIAATTNNSLGVAGVDQQVRLLIARALGKCGGYLSDILDAMRWAGGVSDTQGRSGSDMDTSQTVTGLGLPEADIINLSLGAAQFCGPAEQEAIDALNAVDKLVVVAAGNSGLNLDETPFTPASCTGVITLGALDRDGSLAFYSNYGADLSVSGAGGEAETILATSNEGTTDPILGGPGDIYVGLRGTSMAAGLASGVVALMLAADPALIDTGQGRSYFRVDRKLRHSVAPFLAGSGCDTSRCGYGMLRADLAVSPYPIADPGADRVVTAGSGESVTLSPLYKPGDTSLSFSWSQTQGITTVDTTTETVEVTAPTTAENLEFELRVEDGSANVDTARVWVYVDGPPVLDASAAPSRPLPAGEAIKFLLQATDPNGTASSFHYDQLPPGAVLNQRTGEFSWPNPSPGNHSVMVYARDGLAGSTLESERVSFTLEIQAAGDEGGIGATSVYGLLMLLLLAGLGRRP